jgi:hypothetical protein
MTKKRIKITKDFKDEEGHPVKITAMVRGNKYITVIQNHTVREMTVEDIQTQLNILFPQN